MFIKGKGRADSRENVQSASRLLLLGTNFASHRSNFSVSLVHFLLVPCAKFPFPCYNTQLFISWYIPHFLLVLRTIFSFTFLSQFNSKDPNMLDLHRGAGRLCIFHFYGDRIFRVQI